MSGNMKVLQWQKGCDMRVKDERRQGGGERGQSKEEQDREENLREKGEVMCHIQEGEGEEDRNNNSLVLSRYSDKFLSRQGASAQAGARSDDKPLPHCTAVLAIYDQATYKSQLGLNSSWVGVVTLGFW